MTLVDNETGENIINPYITLYGPGNCWASLNTSNFKDVQSELIGIHEEDIQMKLAGGNERRLYKVVATIGKTNAYTKTVRTEGANDAVALVPLGYLLEDIVKEKFPNTFVYFEEARKKEKRQE
jgi:hypothetical protein